MLYSEKHPHEGKAQGQVSTTTSLYEDKSMLKHIMKKCKTVNYVDAETSSGTLISSRRRSRTTPARLHRACTVERLNTNIEELTKHNTADLFTKNLDGLRIQSFAKKLGLRILDGTNGVPTGMAEEW